jgi:hypothetical protein
VLAWEVVLVRAERRRWMLLRQLSLRWLVAEEEENKKKNDYFRELVQKAGGGGKRTGLGGGGGDSGDGEELKLRKVERDAQKQKVNAAKEEALANKIKEQLEDEIGADPEVVKQKVRAAKKSRASAKKSRRSPPLCRRMYPGTVARASERESGDENDGLAPSSHSLFCSSLFRIADSACSKRLYEEAIKGCTAMCVYFPDCTQQDWGACDSASQCCRRLSPNRSRRRGRRASCRRWAVRSERDRTGPINSMPRAT